MKLLSRLHLTAIAAVVIMAVGVGVAVAGTQGHHQPGGKHGVRVGKHGHDGKCPHGRQLERNKATVVAYYTTAFNDQKPEEAVAKLATRRLRARAGGSRAARSAGRRVSSRTLCGWRTIVR